MNIKTFRPAALPVLWIALILILAGCQPTAIPARQTNTPVSLTATPGIQPSATPPPTLEPTATDTPVPAGVLSFRPGETYFRLDDKPAFVLSRNPTGKTRADFNAALEMARQGQTRLLRVHLTHGWWGDPWINKDWTVNETWARDWEQFFDRAEAEGMYVLPVFGVWADWNIGIPDLGSPFWQYNPLNSANGGPLDSSYPLFTADSDAQKHWLEWMKSLVQRWQGRKNIIGWEIFSEINIATGPNDTTDMRGGVDEPAGEAFTERAVAVIRAADGQHRPVTLSLAGIYSMDDPWAKYYQLEPLDFIEIHPYSDQLDRQLVFEVRQNLAKYHKPVMIGESGLWSMNEKPNALIGIQHAMWAGLVAGAMNGRGLWYNDGYIIYNEIPRDEALKAMQIYAEAELPVANFTTGIDFSGVRPLTATSTDGVWGAAIGNEKMVMAWFRDAGCEPPDWNLKANVSGQEVTIILPGNSAGSWKVDFYDTKTGKDLLSSTSVEPKGGSIRIPLPEFRDDIAIKAYSVE